MTLRKSQFRRRRGGTSSSTGISADPRRAFMASETDEHDFWEMYLVGYESELARLWAGWRDGILDGFVATNPGRRPRGFWQYEVAAEPLRKRVGGSGVAIHMPRRAISGRLPPAVTADWFRFPLGVPSRWDRESLVANDPPIYESQASYLLRLGLLLSGERQRLTERDFEPETLVLDDDGGLVKQ
jgi:hypothetical protein